MAEELENEVTMGGSLSFSYNGKGFVGFTRENALAVGVPEETIAAAEVDVKWKEIRAKRNGLLSASDWAAMPDSPVTDQQAWLDYRTALRNIPQTFSADPDSVVWPVAP